MIWLIKYYLFKFCFGCFILPEQPPTEGGGPTKPISPPKVPKLPTKLGASPGLLTSTGGLFGLNEILVTPAINLTTGNNLIINYDSSDFNCEEPSEYDFRQEANYGQFPGEGRQASFHLIILKYRELGEARFSINITVFNQVMDDFKTILIPVNISKWKRKLFPDGRIHTQRLTPTGGAFQGERPQVTITRFANSGPLSITKLVLCGNADETAQQ